MRTELNMFTNNRYQPKRCLRGLLALALLASGCASLPMRKRDVPFHPQTRRNHCGVNCLAMAFDYFSIPYTQDTLAAQAFVPALDGSTPELLADVAEEYGLSATIQELQADVIAQALRSEGLPIVFLPPAGDETVGHFILVTGAAGDPHRIRAHDGMHPHRRQRLAANATYRTILLAPNEKDTDEKND